MYKIREYEEGIIYFLNTDQHEFDYHISAEKFGVSWRMEWHRQQLEEVRSVLHHD